MWTYKTYAHLFVSKLLALWITWVCFIKEPFVSWNLFEPFSSSSSGPDRDTSQDNSSIRFWRILKGVHLNNWPFAVLFPPQCCRVRGCGRLWRTAVWQCTLQVQLWRTQYFTTAVWRASSWWAETAHIALSWASGTHPNPSATVSIYVLSITESIL